MRGQARSVAAVGVLVAAGLAACGGNALKDKADDVVRGTGFTVDEVIETGDDTGRVIVEAEDGSKVEFSVIKDAGDLALDACDQLNEGGYGCVDLNEWP